MPIEWGSSTLTYAQGEQDLKHLIVEAVIVAISAIISCALWISFMAIPSIAGGFRILAPFYAVFYFTPPGWILYGVGSIGIYRGLMKAFARPSDHIIPILCTHRAVIAVISASFSIGSLFLFGKIQEMAGVDTRMKSTSGLQLGLYSFIFCIVSIILYICFETLLVRFLTKKSKNR
jgi:hypothetical protein